jgi:hypothetical protein
MPLRGSFTLSFRGAETPALPYDAAAELVEQALNNLPTIDIVQVRRARPSTSAVCLFLLAAAFLLVWTCKNQSSKNQKAKTR